MQHTPVMCKEVIESLAIDPKGIYIDATFGRGGHSRNILTYLGPEGFLFAVDKDPCSQEAAKKVFGNECRFGFERGSFANLVQFAEERGWLGKVNGIVFDLGVSSPQLEDRERGFSFMRDGPLDMRMDPTTGISAAEWIARAQEDELSSVLWQFGEERFSRRIARAIVARRREAPIVTTLALAKIIERAVPKRERGKHPATRSFQAIRIFINEELEDLKKGLTAALEILKVGGRLVVISFHSLEDRIVKRFMREAALSAAREFSMVRVRVVLAKSRPRREEVATNPRARSALMRVMEKT